MKTRPDFYAQWFDESPVQAPPDSLVHGTLRWILRRLNEGFVEPRGGQLTTFLTIGNEHPDEPLGDAFARAAKERRMAVNIAGVFAEARERGVKPEHLDIAEELRFAAGESGHMNTEFHYAMQLLDLLPEMRRRSFDLVTLPLLGSASEGLLDLLHEATKAHLLGLHTACVAVCRAALERALLECVPEAFVANERRLSPTAGHLEQLISAAKRAGLFDTGLAGLAHGLRIRANAVLHGNSGKTLVDDSFVSISDVRLLVERLFNSSQR